MKGFRIRTNTRLLALMLLAFSVTTIYAQKKTSVENLRVLYVGGATNWEKDAYETKEDENKDVENRMVSFENMLKLYFAEVKVIHAKDYTEDASKGYDVTVMDGVPKAIAGREVVKDEKGKITKYIPASYLTENFDTPMLFIGSTGETMGRRTGLKMDWYCLCLDAHAHSYRKDHPIFKGPFPVKLTEEIKDTPEDAFHYEYFSDKPYPKTLNMFRVQTKGYITDRNFKIGMVSRPWGFEDSPDTEYISSGVSQKTLDAVAIGRHGNYFHWGFAASPEYMTDEAKVVLANAIAYISKFKGKGVIARKYSDRRATKEYVKELKYLATRKAYEDGIQRNLEFDKMMFEEKKQAEAKKAKGDKLNQREEMSLSYKKQPEQTFEDFLKRSQGLFFNSFGTNTEAYLRFYTENEPYFYSEDASYVISVDEDVKSLKIPNTDKRLLEKCIEMLEKSIDVDKAKRILNRYTLLNFDSAEDYRNWYQKNESKLFFTQSGGWYFMVDTYDKNEPANNYKNKEPEEVTYKNIKPAETSHENTVSMATGVVDIGNNKKELVVKMKVHPGYHIYAFVSDVDPYINTNIHIKLPPGYEKVGDLQKPSFKYFNASGTTIYEDEVLFKQTINGIGTGDATITITYQCCDSHICFPPVEEKYSIRI